jgi:hypothetical protein
VTDEHPSPSGAPAPSPPRAHGAAGARPHEYPHEHPRKPARERPRKGRSARPGSRDRWAHRRAEPRMLAFAWTMYLLIATGMSFARVGLAEPVDVQVYRASARALLLTVAIGACILWPMVRLSQALPKRPLWDTFKDLLVIVAPMQAVIWGQALLSRWPVQSLGAVAIGLAAWTAICGGILAMAMGAGGAPERRLGAMVAIVVVTCAGGAVVLAEGLGPRTGLLSPYTMPWALLGRDLSLGYTLGPTPAQWGAVIGLCLGAGAPWLVAAAMGGTGDAARTKARNAAGANNGRLAELAPKR